MKELNFTGIVQKALFDYKMLSPGDKICLGLSGGKDSLACLHAMSAIRKYSPVPFELTAVTLDLGFENTDYSYPKRLCAKIEVPYHIVSTDIGKIVFDIRQEKKPCSLCANLRRGALNRTAVELGCNKVILGHNRDDAIETFMMNLLYEGSFKSFMPVTYLSRMNIHVLRPLLYAKEEEVMSYCDSNNLTPVKSPCPATGTTARAKTKSFLNDMEKTHPQIRDRIFNALLNSNFQGW